MRCKRHTVDFTSTVGVCASCLHERLLSLAASIAAVEDNNNLRQSRKSSSPRSGAGGGEDLGISGKDFESNRSEKSKEVKVSRISNPFRGRSDSNAKSESSSSSRSWISSFLSTGRSKKQPTNKACYIEDVISRCRGMSPARDARAEDGNEVPSDSIEETPERPRRTTPAMKTPGRRKVMTGMGFCLSPLVRARPNCPFKRKSRFPSEIAGEVTAGEKPHISEAASFVANRSKKLVDLGRGNPRR